MGAKLKTAPVDCHHVDATQLPSGSEQEDKLLPPPPLLRIPRELRLMIYDLLFEKILVVRPEHFDTYVLPSEWTENELGSLHSMLMTCNQLRAEARSYFEQRYLPKLTLYFDNVPKLLHCTNSLMRLDARYQDVRICLHSSTAVAQHFHPHSSDDSDIWKHYYAVASDLSRFIFRQMGDESSSEDRASIKVNCVERSTTVCHRLGKQISVTQNFVSRTGVRITGHTMPQKYGCNYVVLSGRAKDLRLTDTLTCGDTKSMRTTFTRTAKAKLARAKSKFHVPYILTTPFTV